MSDEPKPYVTTSAEWRERGRYSGDSEPRDEDIPDPEWPGHGYVLEGSAATDGRLFWFWKHAPTFAPPKERP